jgi:hypothetical protein
MIEVVRGRVDGPVADQMLAFWERHGALSRDEARRRLPELVCVLRGNDGAIAGASSVLAAEVPLIGSRRFWIYRSLLPGDAAEEGPAMITATFNALDAEFDGRAGSPIGLCVLIADAAERRRRPEAEWSDPRMIYAGYLDDGRQVRIAYFEDAVVTTDV